jgi:transposase-like protein
VAAVIAQVKGEVFSLDVVTNENGAGEKAFLRSLVARGFGGEDRVFSRDARRGLKAALASTLPRRGGALCIGG